MFGRRKASPPPAEDPQALYERGKILRKDHRTWSEAEALLTQAAGLGHKVAMFDLGVLLEQQHRGREAREWYERAQLAGHLLAGRALAHLDEQDAVTDRRRADLAPLLQRAEDGDAEAMFDYAWRLRASFPLEDHGSWFLRSAQAGHRPAFREMARTTEQSDPDRTEQMLRLDADHGDIEGLHGLSDFLRFRDPEAAVPLLERQHELGDERGAPYLASLHWRAGRLEAAERWFRLAVGSATDSESADDHAAALGCVLVEQGRGREPEVEPLLRRSIDGDLHLAWLLEARGDDDAAEALYSGLVESDDDQTEAKAGLARVLHRRGDDADAELFRGEALAAGESLELPDFIRRI